MKDASTGRKLTVAMDLSIDEMRIDGVPVVRKTRLEWSPEELIFGAPLARRDEMFIIERARLNGIRKMWGFPEI